MRLRVQVKLMSLINAKKKPKRQEFLATLSKVAAARHIQRFWIHYKDYLQPLQRARVARVKAVLRVQISWRKWIARNHVRKNIAARPDAVLFISESGNLVIRFCFLTIVLM